MLRTVRDCEPSLFLAFGRDDTIVQLVRVAQIVDVEELGCERIATIVALAPIGVDVHAHDSTVLPRPGGPDILRRDQSTSIGGHMAIGPVEYMVVAFPGNQFTGEIVPALEELVGSGTISILDLAFVTKDVDGVAAAFELEDFDSDAGRAFQRVEAIIGDLVNAEDLEEIGAALEPNSSAAILVWEDVWATRLRDAIVNAGGELLDLEPVPLAVVEAALEYSDAITQ